VATKNREVERWFAELEHPQQDALQRIREIILDTDACMTELVQHRTLQFVYEGDLPSFVQLGKKPITLMFNVGRSASSGAPQDRRRVVRAKVVDDDPPRRTRRADSCRRPNSEEPDDIREYGSRERGSPPIEGSRSIRRGRSE
jgi:hypothetical protein